MEHNVTTPETLSAAACLTCHQAVEPTWYFCPNCGAKLKEAPLPTNAWAQIKLYGASIFLPMICFIFVTRWQGMTYVRAKDPKARQMGIIAWILIVLSTIVVVWLAVVWTQNTIQAQVNAINTDFSGL